MAWRAAPPGLVPSHISFKKNAFKFVFYKSAINVECPVHIDTTTRILVGLFASHSVYLVHTSDYAQSAVAFQIKSYKYHRLFVL